MKKKGKKREGERNVRERQTAWEEGKKVRRIHSPLLSSASVFGRTSLSCMRHPISGCRTLSGQAMLSAPPFTESLGTRMHAMHLTSYEQMQTKILRPPPSHTVHNTQCKCTCTLMHVSDFSLPLPYSSGWPQVVSMTDFNLSRRRKGSRRSPFCTLLIKKAGFIRFVSL